MTSLASVIHYKGRSIAVQVNETALNALLRAGIDVPFSCKSGACHTCMSKCLEGVLPERAQRGLADDLIAKHYFLPCICKPVGDIWMCEIEVNDLFEPASTDVAGVCSASPALVKAGELTEIPYPKPAPTIWMTLTEPVDKVRQVLEDFYAAVYADPALAPFFERITQDRVTGKQYSFLKQCFTGEKVYMGDRPRNAHHWMVISDELMDHRQALMHAALVANGLTAEQIAHWVRIEEHFRTDIVKSEVWPKRIGDKELFTEGFAQEILLEATVCDHCGAEIAAHTLVTYHRRLGQVSCSVCASGLVVTP